MKASSERLWGGFLINLKHELSLYVFFNPVISETFNKILPHAWLSHYTEKSLYNNLPHSSHIFVFTILKLENTRASEIFIGIPYSLP